MFVDQPCARYTYVLIIDRWKLSELLRNVSIAGSLYAVAKCFHVLLIFYCICFIIVCAFSFYDYLYFVYYTWLLFAKESNYSAFIASYQIDYIYPGSTINITFLSRTEYKNWYIQRAIHKKVLLHIPYNCKYIGKITPVMCTFCI